MRLYHINPFAPNAPFFYPLKVSENLRVFLCFQGVEKGCIGNKWVKEKTAKAMKGIGIIKNSVKLFHGILKKLMNLNSCLIL